MPKLHVYLLSIIMSASEPQVWLVTGAGTGLGREIVLAALARGDRVIATARSLSKVQDLADTYPESCHALALDVTDTFDNIQQVANDARGIWGHVDVLVNNAGHFYPGSMEELGARVYQKQYEVNVFSVVNITNAFLPEFRARRSGTVVVIGSRSGIQSKAPLTGLYASSKSALHGVTESMMTELTPFNIRILLVQPGALRTPGFDHALEIASAPNFRTQEIADYGPMQNAVESFLREKSGKQPGDTSKAANVIVDVVRGEGQAQGKPWPQWLVLGSDARKDIENKYHTMLEEIARWKDVTDSIDY